MSDVNSGGVRIHYEVEGEGPALLLQHGFSTGLKQWRVAGYVRGLEDDYQVILVDARGHGQSEKPHNPSAYAPELMAADLLAVLDKLEIAKAHAWGYAMGASIVRDLANAAQERVASLILGGFGPQAPEEPPAQPAGADPMKEALQQGLEAYVEYADRTMGGLRPEAKAIIMANDPEALLAYYMDRPQVSTPPHLPTVPCLVYVGEADEVFPRARAYAERLRQAQFFALPGLGRSPAFARSDLVLPHVKRFLASVSATTV